MSGLFSCLDVISVATKSDRSLQDVVKIYFALDEQLHWGWLRTKIGSLPQENYWQSLARSALLDDFHRTCQMLSQDAVSSGIKSIAKLITSWFERHTLAVDRYSLSIRANQSEAAISLEQTIILLKQLYSIAIGKSG